MQGFLIVRTLLLTIAALAALASPASAADYDPVRNKLVFKPHPVEAPEPSLFTTTSAFTWSGFYLGIQAGYASGEDRSRLLFAGTPVALPVSTRYDIDGAVAGVHTGYNVQLGMFVLGAEGDLELSAIEGSFAANSAGVPIGVAARTNVNWQSSVRARVGVAMDRLLVYGTGGFVYAEIDNAFALSAPPAPSRRRLRTPTVSAGRWAAASNTPSSATSRHGQSIATRASAVTRSPRASCSLASRPRRSRTFTRFAWA
ncbi:MAG TPA: hypothetical protein VGU24_14100 [Microvirga sp.]|jgi:opacity protein-like surface antigen|nr:hypothetical protein [Microvirga sp.]